VGAGARRIGPALTAGVATTAATKIKIEYPALELDGRPRTDTLKIKVCWRR
jgi:hypothetical protein